MTAYYEKEVETMPRTDLENLKLLRLQNLVGYVYDNCDFYRKKLEEAGIKPTGIKDLEDLKKLPFTTKQDLRNNYPYGLFSAPMSNIVRIHASSGTTGKLTVAGYTQNDIDVWSLVMARSLVASGCSHTSIVNVAYGYGLFTGGLGAHYGSELLGALTIPASSGNTKRQLQMFKDLKVTTLCCTPSYALYLADEMENEGYKISDLSLKQGLFGAEPWSEEMREQIERKLGIKAYNIYGLSEIIGPGVSVECECQQGSHIWEDHFLPEIIDPETLEPLEYGKQGELVFTTISKTGMPLIRYRTRDLCSLIKEPCKCGRTTIRMTKIIGRSDDMLIIGGVNVFPSQIESALFTVKDIEPHYQIIVDRVNNLDKIEIQVEIKDELFSDEVKNIQNLKAQLEKNVSSAISVNANIHFVSRGTIERSQGKAVRVIDKRRI
jgi:phenylacetate-CoA ligase